MSNSQQPKTLKQVFDKANPAIWQAVQRKPELAEQLRSLQDRTTALRQKMHAHILKHRQLWIARETVKVFEERERLNYTHPAPNWAEKAFTPPYLPEARKRVQDRIQRRFQTLTLTSQRMQEQLVKTLGNRPDFTSDPLTLKVHHIMNRTRHIRNKAQRHFVENKKKWIKQARKQGIQKPERFVYEQQGKRIKRIETAQHNLTQQAFQEYGLKMSQTRVPNLKRDFEQGMG